MGWASARAGETPWEELHDPPALKLIHRWQGDVGEEEALREAKISLGPPPPHAGPGHRPQASAALLVFTLVLDVQGGRRTGSDKGSGPASAVLGA